jgi:hypothetical protein
MVYSNKLEFATYTQINMSVSKVEPVADVPEEASAVAAPQQQPQKSTEQSLTSVNVPIKVVLDALRQKYPHVAEIEIDTGGHVKHGNLVAFKDKTTKFPLGRGRLYIHPNLQYDAGSGALLAIVLISDPILDASLPGVIISK